MKRALLFGCVLVLAAVCAPRPSPQAAEPATASPTIKPAPYAWGSPNNTTSAFDGTYVGVSLQNLSPAGSTLSLTGTSAPVPCPNYDVPPLTISHGLAQFGVPELGLIFQGYVTPQGELPLRSGYGQTYTGHIDSQGMITGKGVGTCAYAVTWRKSS